MLPVFRRTVSAVLYLGLTIAPAAAQPILEGAEDKRLLSAIRIWLDDNDRDSLPVIQSLARSGNRAARLLIARIEAVDREPKPFVLRLSRDQRHDLFRSPSKIGVFRRTWISTEAEGGNPHAIALQAATRLGINQSAVRRLVALGESEAAEHLIRKIAVDGRPSDRQAVAELLGRDHELRPYLQAFTPGPVRLSAGETALLHILSAIKNGGDIPGTGKAWNDAALFLDIGYQSGEQTPDFNASNPYFASVGRWVLTASVTAPLANYCRSFCRQAEQLACANTALGLVGGYYEAVRFDSPLETLIPQKVFLASKRAWRSVARRVATIRTEANAEVFTNAEFTAKSACLAKDTAAMRDVLHRK